MPTPRNLGRLPLSATRTVATDPAATAQRIRTRAAWLAGRRRDEPGGVATISAEKGFLREVGNLIFHFSLLGILGAVAVGKMFGFEGTVVVTEGSGFCSGSPAAYDSFRPGLLIDGTDLAPFCVDLDSFRATYTAAGAATDFSAAIRYQTGTSADPDSWTPAELKVNEPLRISGERLYLLGHGYAPEFTITFPGGEQRTRSQVFQPSDGTLLSEGVVKVLDPPGYTGDEVRQHQLALQGLFAPSAVVVHGVLTSAFPAPDNPAVAIQVYRGDLGMEDGASQSIFQLDQRQVDSGALTKLDRANLALGESMTLDDGTVITFSGYRQWVQLQTSYDPAQGYALVFAITLLGGLMVSLLIKRRRVWYRIRPVGGDAGGSTGGDRRPGPHRPGRLRRGVRPARHAGGAARWSAGTGDRPATRRRHRRRRLGCRSWRSTKRWGRCPIRPSARPPRPTRWR